MLMAGNSAAAAGQEGWHDEPDWSLYKPR